ncbi:uncharacterized protein HMPREF1541_08653 [Cyphellophora europaea CBS 101466]|uniref:BZIP domain-containing protein n=1 Tax=Cyphellophora europaea (strain CBS 101466) TaxID=1220924 RepID=W2RIV1_CYPE1|nr:uncharacterized protein HMPREF1541_08653 [Cyphellophora europaea CBS 101466]ETN36376.1 hypothetical protein HMPREF1541_08653 [Cyphellophora europaea CBS 101466]
MSYQWDYSAMTSPRTMVNQYNHLLERAADFYTAIDNGRDSMSSGSSASYRSTPERRESTSTSVIAQVKKSIPDKIERRREQNRSSQRAYRDRKERHQRELEQQIADWRQKHQMLSKSYSKQGGEVRRLKSQIEQLTSEIAALQSGLPSLCGSLSQSPTEFDLVPFFEVGTPMSVSSPRVGMHQT